jgi:hypothetical protein
MDFAKYQKVVSDEYNSKTIGTFKELEEEIGSKKVIVFGGFSGLGYKDQEKLLKDSKERIEKEITLNGKDNVVIVCGATSDGIGVIYKVAHDLGVATYGIVMEAGKEYGSDRYCDKTLFVPNTNNSWKVLSPEGESYMVDIAKKNGTLVYYGGGDVAVSEIKEAKQKGIPVETDVSFEPNPAQVEKIKAEIPDFDPTPLRTFITKEDASNNIPKIIENTTLK